MSYKKIFATLNEHGVKYLIVGGLAVNLYGIPRFTFDLDIIVENKKENYENLVKALKKLHFIPKINEKIENLIDEDKRNHWIKKKNMIAFCTYNKNKPYEELDIIIKYNLNFEKEYKNKVVFTIENIAFPVISIDGLIRMKKESNRKQDIEDIKLLRKIKNEE